ncbi:MAG: AEC family transporter [Proteobacteria bacterium]|nr:AEC family transporter [Pseudomonadota bacterium]MBI3496049.1 AEC family transporter [Pseudomonadota bacterium]
METAIQTVLPMFGLVLTGYVVARLRVIASEGVRGIGSFVYYLAIPALLFRTMAEGSHGTSLDLGILWAYFAGAYGSFALAMAVGRLAFRLRLEEQAILGMGAAFANTVQIGIPLIFTLFGEAGVVPMTLLTSFHSMTLFPITMIIIEFARGGHSGGLRVLLATARALAQNPIIVAVLLGLGWSQLGLVQPRALDTFTRLLSGAATPCALFALGASLSGYSVAANLPPTLTMVAFKLFAHPLFVWLLARFVFHVDPLWAAIATITAALPVGANVFIMAQRYQALLGPTTAAIVISTAASMLTVALLIAALVPVG